MALLHLQIAGSQAVSLQPRRGTFTKLRPVRLKARKASPMFAYSFALVERVRAELNRLRADRKGITALEYGILAAIMVAALVAGFGGVTGKLSALFTSIGGKLTIT
jgi:pilus assembly protein Flp/PilA